MNTRDITSQFQEATQYVTAGSLIKDDHFSLFEAVGALEIGDPKMDSGCLEAGEALEDDFNISQHFSPEELVWLMDQLLNREVAWLMGYPLSQTLFTSLHIDRLLWPASKQLKDVDFVRGRDLDSLTLSHQVLRAYCVLLIKACDLVLGLVTSQHYYEEEDFTTQLFNRDLLHRFAGEDVRKIGSAAVRVLDDSVMGEQVKKAIHVRLEFRMNVLEMLLQHADGMTPPITFFSSLQDQIVCQEDSQELGRPVDGTFSTKLQRRLASTVPPRPMVTVSMNEAWSFWRQMLNDCKDVFSVQLAGHSQDLFTAYQLYAYRTPPPSTYPRTLLQSFLTLNGGLVVGRLDSLHFLEEDLRSLSLPASQMLSDPSDANAKVWNGNQEITRCMQEFIDKFEHTFTNLYRALCLNGCRIRRTFCHALLEWDGKQGQIEELDTLVQTELQDQSTVYPPTGQPTFAYPLSSWVYHHKLTLLRLTVQMGFEQAIYAPHEQPGMYYYLSNICSMHLSHLERISHFVTKRDTAVKSDHMLLSSKQPLIEECRQALDRLFRQYTWIKATELLANTLHCIFVVLQRFGIHLPQKSVYSSDDLRYEIRMKPFLGLSIPEPILSCDYRRESEMNHVSTEAVLEQAAKASNAARKAWEEVSKTSWHIFPLARSGEEVTSEEGGRVIEAAWKTEVRDCLRASIAAGLCIVTLSKVIGNEAWKAEARKVTRTAGVEDNGRWHRWWAIPSLPSAR